MLEVSNHRMATRPKRCVMGDGGNSAVPRISGTMNSAACLANSFDASLWTKLISNSGLDPVERMAIFLRDLAPFYERAIKLSDWAIWLVSGGLVAAGTGHSSTIAG